MSRNYSLFNHTRIGFLFSLWRFAVAVCVTLLAFSAAADPIRLHPENPHYFLFHNRPTVLLTAGEHYGAVMNLDFDYVRYLNELKTHGFNLTRTFSGTYREIGGSFAITGNPLNPAPGRFVCPWARSGIPGASDGGNQFDLSEWDPNYFERLKDFIAQAGERGIVVELVLYCTMYNEELWNASPMNPRNHTGDIGKVGPYEVYSDKDPQLTSVQKALVQKIVNELNGFDNLYYEICNEPYERAGVTREWNDQMVAAIVDAEAALPGKHLIAQGVGIRTAQIKDPNPHISILNFHLATPDSVYLNYDLNRVIAYDETGGADQSDRMYRTEGWEFILAGGGVYDHLDFSFTPEHEDGSLTPLPSGTPGGGSPELRRQLQILKEFIEGFDFIRMSPMNDVIQEVENLVPEQKGQPTAKAYVRVLAEAGKAYAVYVKGGTQVRLALELPEGSYQAEWVDTKVGAVVQGENFTHSGGMKTLVSPVYVEDIALRIKSITRIGNDRQRNK